MTDPHIYVIAFAHETDKPMGGTKMLYRLVDTLNASGFSSSILHEQKGFRYTWFENQTKISYIADCLVRPSDFVVIPEDLGVHIVNIFPGISKVICNQNCYFTFAGYPLDKQPLITAYLYDEIKGVMVGSEDSKQYLRYVFPDLRIFRLYHYINTEKFLYQEEKKRQICYMPRKRLTDIQQVINILKFRNALDDFELVPIDNKSEQEVAAILKDSLIFLSFGHPEGFSLPPAEAMACGCIVIGYHGGGAKEYLRPEFSFPIEVGDILGYAKTVEDVIHTYNQNPNFFKDKTKKAAQFIKNTYSQENEKQAIVDCWKTILNR